MPLSVLICDDRPLMREGLDSLLRGEPGIGVAASADSRRDALAKLRSGRPDVVVIGIRPGGPLDAAFVRTLRSARAESAVVAYTPDDQAGEVLRAGADGVLSATAARGELVHAIKAVAGGSAVLGPAATQQLVVWHRAQLNGVRRRPGRTTRVPPAAPAQHPGEEEA